MICPNPKCGSDQTIKYGRAIRKGGPVQQMRCKKCGHIFVPLGEKQK